MTKKNQTKVPRETYRILSLGAGVQSSTIALMIEHGEIEPVDAAIFADTGWEPKAVYDWFGWLEEHLSYPVYRVSKANLREACLTVTDKKAPVPIPMFINRDDGGGKAILNRQCTRDYKVKPVQRKIREIAGIKRGQRKDLPRVEVLVGISLDEAQRVRPHSERWGVNVYPLIDKRMTRHDCLVWMERNGYPEPVRSACLGCPFHDDASWRDVRENKQEWQEVIQFERDVRAVQAQNPARKMDVYLHASLKPIDQVDFDTAEDYGQVNWLDECTGMCGN